MSDDPFQGLAELDPARGVTDRVVEEMSPLVDLWSRLEVRGVRRSHDPAPRRTRSVLAWSASVAAVVAGAISWVAWPSGISVGPAALVHPTGVVVLAPLRVATVPSPEYGDASAQLNALPPEYSAYAATSRTALHLPMCAPSSLRQESLVPRVTSRTGPLDIRYRVHTRGAPCQIGIRWSDPRELFLYRQHGRLVQWAHSEATIASPVSWVGLSSRGETTITLMLDPPASRAYQSLERTQFGGFDIPCGAVSAVALTSLPTVEKLTTHPVVYPLPYHVDVCILGASNVRLSP